MKLLLPFVLLLTAPVFARGADGVPARSPQPTNALVILSEAPGEFTTTNAVWRKQVRAGDGEVYLECELLTVFFATNSVRTNAARTVRTVRTNAAAAPRRAGEAGADSGIDRVLAETNVMIIFGDFQVVGHRAEYTATNDLLTVTGTPVLVENERGYVVCPWVTHHRASKATVFGEPNTTYVIGSLLSRTNVPSAVRKTNSPPAPAPPPPALKPH